MINRDIFSSRLRSLRLSHDLSGAVLADLLLFKNQSSIGNLESGKSLPLLDAVERLADLFAVSVDWILGRINPMPTDIYNSDIIDILEESLLKKAKTFGQGRDIDEAYNIKEDSDVNPLAYFRLEVNVPLITIPSPYREKNQRIEKYDLSVRANIIFAMKVFYHLSLRFYQLYQIQQQNMNLMTVNNVIFPQFRKTKNGTALLNLAEKCRYFYSTYLSQNKIKKIEMPFYNVGAFVMR